MNTEYLVNLIDQETGFRKTTVSIKTREEYAIEYGFSISRLHFDYKITVISLVFGKRFYVDYKVADCVFHNPETAETIAKRFIQRANASFSALIGESTETVH